MLFWFFLEEEHEGSRARSICVCFDVSVVPLGHTKEKHLKMAHKNCTFCLAETVFEDCGGRTNAGWWCNMCNVTEPSEMWLFGAR